jgi:ATP phosphoribosyltransferase
MKRRKKASQPKRRVKVKKKTVRSHVKKAAPKAREASAVPVSRGLSGMRLKLGLPKGSLQKATLDLFKQAGFQINATQRSYFPTIDDEEVEVVLLRAQEMSRYVEAGALDAGITGNDWIMENGSDILKVADLSYSKQGFDPVRWVLAVPIDSGIARPKDLEGKRLATELVALTRSYLKSHKVNASVEFSWGATEAKVGTGLVDAIVELTETGSSLRANKLRIVDTICSSTTQLIANKNTWKEPWKRKKLESIATLLRGAILGRGKVGLKLNVSKKRLKEVLQVLPAIKKPTVSPLSSPGWFAIETVLDEKLVRALIPELKKVGGEGIIEYSLNKIIY